MNNTNYREVHTIEGFGGSGKFCLKILMDIGRDFTEKDKEVIWECADKLKQGVMGETARLDPENKKRAVEDRKNIIALFGEQAIFVQEIPNGYHSNSEYYSMFPWFKITTKLGHFVIGWRKRVINIDWSETTIKEKSRDIFPDEDVTKEDKFIHAYGYENAQRYINKLFSL